jgi:hypothetical protein
VPTPPSLLVLSREEWRERQHQHHKRVEPWVAPVLERKANGRKHPVFDFLFTYYTFRPAQLRRWSPGVGVLLEGGAQDGEELSQAGPFVRWGGGWKLEEREFPPARRQTLASARRLLEATAERSPQFSCGGMHEWAMVYRQDPTQARHQQVPLRLAPAALAAWVESRPILCTHYDAFRFFTEAARPLNRCQPTKETRPEWEQPGCLHANMDLYKWAYKLAPWVPADLVADAFALALAAREIDMRASPYDLRALGFPPIAVETEEGRREYEGGQRDIFARAQPLRQRLLEACRSLELWVATSREEQGEEAPNPIPIPDS